MKILIISQYFWPENFQINGFAQSLLKRGHRVTVLTGLPNYPQGKIYPGYKNFFPYKENWQGINIIRIPLISRGNKSSLRLTLNYLSFAFLATIFAPIICREKYNASLVFATSPIIQAFPAIILKWFRNIPNFLWVQDLWPESLVSTKKVTSKNIIELTKKIVSFIYKHTDHILIPSQAFEDHLKSQFYNIKKLSYFPNSTDFFYKPMSLLPEKNYFNLPIGFKILFAGNIGSAQAISVILDAAEKLKNHQQIKWIFIGEGSERIILEENILKRNLQNLVFWKGSYPSTEMPYLFSVADVLLLSLSKSEIFSLTIPSKLQSYFACGKPILASIDGEAQRIIQQANAGLAAPAENPELLANLALKFYHMSNAERAKLGMNGYQYAIENYDQHSRIAQLENWISEESRLIK